MVAHDTVQHCCCAQADTHGAKGHSTLADFTRPQAWRLLIWRPRHQEIHARYRLRIRALCAKPHQPIFHQARSFIFNVLHRPAVTPEELLQGLPIQHHQARREGKVRHVAIRPVACGHRARSTHAHPQVLLVEFPQTTAGVVNYEHAQLANNLGHKLLQDAHDLCAVGLFVDLPQHTRERLHAMERQHILAIPTETQLHNPLDLLHGRPGAGTHTLSDIQQSLQSALRRFVSELCELLIVHARCGWHLEVRIEAHLRGPEFATEDPVKVRGLRPSRGNSSTLHELTHLKELVVGDVPAFTHGVLRRPQEVPGRDVGSLQHASHEITTNPREVLRTPHEEGVYLILSRHHLSHAPWPIEEIHQHLVAGHVLVRPLSVTPIVIPPDAGHGQQQRWHVELVSLHQRRADVHVQFFHTASLGMGVVERPVESHVHERLLLADGSVRAESLQDNSFHPAARHAMDW
mmetsp:Transcript_7396/g.20276  ORF Transcript_7396/g.20276 Transcript_7396/m.20276 type:complete len:461 (+) Transcript_7396:111-1493(+)